MKKILELLGLKPDAAEDAACAAIQELQTKLANSTPKITDFEKKVLDRMARGKINRAAAELAVKSQDAADKEIAKRKKAAKP
jgi:hypothetical protein